MQQKCALIFFLLLMLLGFTLPHNGAVALAANLSAPLSVEKPLSNIAQIATGGGHTCALTTAGGVKCWGWNQYGQLGNNSNYSKSTPVDVNRLSNGVSAISAGFYYTCALTTGGGVKCWGWNQYGQLGNNSKIDSSTPVDVFSLSGGIRAISAGSAHACALTTAGGVKCWGLNQYGQLGNNGTTDSSTPVDVSGLGSGVSAISAGSSHTCALTTAGGVKCWGLNQYGQLGDNSTTDRHTPVAVSGLNSGVSAISGGALHTCALTNAGGVRCWGVNHQGQLGNNSTSNSSAPVSVSGLDSGVKTISAGGSNTCALTTTGAVKCWGWNQQGQLGNNSVTDSPIPTDVSGVSSGIAAISVSYHTCVLTTGGSVKCWGWNGFGQLGNDTPGDSRKPVAVSGLSSTIIAISAAGSHTCALTSTGGAKCWGWNVYGQLGDNSLRDRNTFIDVQGLNSGVSLISVGGTYTCVLLTTGGVKCWGDNRFGQLGTGTLQNSYLPVNVVGLESGVSAISAGGGHTCALTTAGGVKCWGANQYGQMGIGNGVAISSSIPLDVSGLGSGVSAISSGEYHTCAITTSGAVKCWGWNQYGQLGNGKTDNSGLPVDVVGLESGVSAISAGSNHTCAVKTSGATCWGANTLGQLGNGAGSDSSTPVAVIGLSNGITAISVGRLSTCALTEAKGVKCWGENRVGQLGNGAIENSNVPMDVSGLSNVSAISAGEYHVCTLAASGAVTCWGTNSFGQLGNGSAWSTTPVNAGESDYFRVQDEAGVPVANAEVWVHSAAQAVTSANQGRVILRTDQDGYFLPANLQPGDKLIALQLMRQQAAADVAHQGWKYRLYRTSMDIGSNGELQPYVVGEASGSTLTVKKGNPLTLFNLVASLEWKSYLDNTNNSSTLEVIENAARNASDLLYDATDGQFAFGQVTIYDGGRNWANADLQILASNYVRPFAIPGGVTEGAPYTYTSSIGKQSTFYPGYMRSGRAWNRYGDPTGTLDNPDGYHMLVHEFAHWAFGLFDEYFYVEGGKLHPATCAPATGQSSPLDYSLMDRSYAATEFEMQGSQAFSEACRQTEQFQVHGESAWETIVRAYSDGVTPSRWEFVQPAPQDLPKAGPTDLHLQLGLPVITSQVTDPMAKLANGTGEIKLKLSNGLARNAQSVSNQPATTYTGNVQVFLLKQKSEAMKIIEQGTTDKYGFIRLVGVEVGDTILAVSWDGTLSAAVVYQQGSTLPLILNAAPWSPVITAQPVLNGADQPTHLAVTVAQAGALTGTLFAVHLPASSGALPPVRLEQVGDLYSGQIPLSTTLSITDVTEGQIWLYEAVNDQPGDAATLKKQIVTTYSSGGSPDSHVRSNPPKDPSTSDGYCAFHLTEDPARERVPTIVLPTRNTPPLPVGATRLQIVSAPCYIGVPAGREIFAHPTPLLMYYNQRIVDDLDPTTPLHIYYWNETAQSWQAQASQDDPLNYFLSATITRTGLYVAAAELPVRVQVIRTNQVGELQLNVVNNPLPQALPIAQFVVTCPAEKIFTTQAGNFERLYSNKPAYVTNLAELQPGQSAQIVPTQDCIMNLGLGGETTVAQTAASTTLTGATAITLPLTSVPSTFYGSVTFNGLNAPSGLPVYAKINGVTYAQGETFFNNNTTVFVLDLAADVAETEAIEGGQPGQVVTFQVGDEVVGQTGAWQAAEASLVNLTLTQMKFFLPLVRR